MILSEKSATFRDHALAPFFLPKRAPDGACVVRGDPCTKANAPRNPPQGGLSERSGLAGSAPLQSRGPGVTPAAILFPAHGKHLSHRMPWRPGKASPLNRGREAK